MASFTDDAVMKAHGITQDVWKSKTPIEQRKMRDAYRSGKVSQSDPSGQKTIHEDVQKKASESAMTNLVQKGKMTEEDKNNRMKSTPVASTNIKDIQKPQVQKEEKEPLQQVSAPDATTFTPEAQNQAIQEVQQLGITEDSNPEDAWNAFLHKAQDEGLIEIDKHGNWKMKQYDSTAGSILRGVGTALSVLLTIATGGVTPPINFYNVRSDNDKQAKEQWDKLQNAFTDTLAKFEQTEQGAAYSTAGGAEKATEAEKVLTAGREREAEIQKDMIQLNFDNQKAMASFQNELTQALLQLQNELGKDMASYNAQLAADQIVKELKSLKKSGYSMTEIAEIIRAKTGVSPTQAVLDRIGQAAGIVGEVAGVVNPGSDGRYKVFKSSKTHAYVPKGDR